MRRHLFLAVCLSVGLLTACITGGTGGSQGAESAEPGNMVSQETDAVKNLTMWVWDDSSGSYSEFVKNYNESNDKNIVVNLEVVPWNNFHDKLLTALSSGGGPDLSVFSSSWLPELVGMESLVDVQPYIDQWDGAADVYESMMKAAKSSYSTMYAYPQSSGVYYLYCRKDLFDQYGVKIPETIDEFYDACRQMTRDTDGDGVTDLYGFAMRGARMGHIMWSSIVYADGNEIIKTFDEQSGAVTLNHKQLVQANQRYLDIYNNGWAPPTAPTDGANEIQQNFKSGVCAMLIHHLASAESISEIFGENVVAVPIPAGSAGRVVPMESILAGIYTNCEYPEAAADVIESMLSANQHDIFCQTHGSVPIIKSVASLPKYMENQFYKVSIESLPEAYSFEDTADMANWQEVVWPTQMQKAMTGQITSEEMMKNLADALKPIER